MAELVPAVRPCRRCGGTLRYASTRGCVACVRERAAARYAAGILPTPCSPEAHREAQRRYRAKEADRHRARMQKRRADGRVTIDPLVVLEASDGVCGVCGDDVDPMSFHVDHVVPIALGGDHALANLAPAHPSCNMAKGARLHR